MEKTKFAVRGEYIQLIKLLKVAGVADSGADAKEMVMAQQVKVNGELELRKRAQIRAGDMVETSTHTIVVEQGPQEK